MRAGATGVCRRGVLVKGGFGEFRAWESLLGEALSEGAADTCRLRGTNVSTAHDHTNRLSITHELLS